jgi:hypothetical protein
VWKQGNTLGLVTVALHSPHLVLTPTGVTVVELLELLLLLLLLQDTAGEDPLTDTGESTRGDSERSSVWSTNDPIEFAPGNESNDGVGEAIFNQTSCL